MSYYPRHQRRHTQDVISNELFSIFEGAAKEKSLAEIVENNAGKLFNRGSILEKYVEQISGKIKRAQLRKFYNYIRSLETQWRDKPGDQNLTKEDRLKLLKINVYLAYAVGRNLIPKDSLDKLFGLMIDRVRTYSDFRALIDVFEAIVAYHVYYEKGSR